MSTITFDLVPIQEWGLPLENGRLVITGPCSAESEQQVLNTAQQVADLMPYTVFRAGVWKPRTRPGNFEGTGEPALVWLEKVREQTGLPIATEVATAEHAQLAIKYGVEVVWIGARTSGDTFAVQAIADAIAGHDLCVLVKNPIAPDLDLWLGALERINWAGITKLGAIHRGFSIYSNSTYRNDPLWQLVRDFKERAPDVPLICDPSHIAGNRASVKEVAQHALLTNLDGLMIESHCDPENAQTDAKQQLTPAHTHELLTGLATLDIDEMSYEVLLAALRELVDRSDYQILSALADRKEVVERIAALKAGAHIDVLQPNRWQQLLARRVDMARDLGISEALVVRIMDAIHEDSCQIQRQHVLPDQNVG